MLLKGILISTLIDNPFPFKANYYKLFLNMSWNCLWTILSLILFISGSSPLEANPNKESNTKIQGYVEGEYVYISAPLAGKLKKLPVHRGEQVKEGDLLFVQENVLEKAAWEQAKVALTLSEIEFNRQEKLIRIPGATSQQEYDRSRSDRDQDRQRVTQAEWNLNQKRQNAPMAGFIFDTLFNKGEWVPAGKSVVTLLPPENIKVRAFVPEIKIGPLQLGEPVRVFVDGIKKPLLGKINFISPKAEFTPPVIYSLETRSKLVFMIEVAFDSQIAATLHPGQPVDVEIE